MTPARPESRTAASDPGAVDARAYTAAILNALEDAAEEREELARTQRALLNILDDSAEEKVRLEAAERAILNILEDSDEEKARLANVELRNEIAERVRVQEALQHANVVAEAASKELEAFSYSVAHDLRAPLRHIDGFSQALLEEYGARLDQAGVGYLTRVRAAAQHMARLIDDLLDLSRVTRGEFRRESVDLSALARAVVARLRELQPAREVTILIQEGLTARGDPRLLDVLLTNLLGNAWKFTGKRAAARIELAATRGEDATVFHVRDDGAGFDPAYAEKLFGAFQRLHSAREFEGTGIGLATVQRIVARHGGRVWAEGRVDGGATFYFTLEEEGRA